MLPLLGLLLWRKPYITRGLSARHPACTSKASFIFQAGRAVVIIYPTLCEPQHLPKLGSCGHTEHSAAVRGAGRRQDMPVALGWLQSGGFSHPTSAHPHQPHPCAAFPPLCHAPCSFFQPQAAAPEESLLWEHAGCSPVNLLANLV